MIRNKLLTMSSSIRAGVPARLWFDTEGEIHKITSSNDWIRRTVLEEVNHPVILRVEGRVSYLVYGTAESLCRRELRVRLREVDLERLNPDGESFPMLLCKFFCEVEAPSVNEIRENIGDDVASRLNPQVPRRVSEKVSGRIMEMIQDYICLRACLETGHKPYVLRQATIIHHALD